MPSTPIETRATHVLTHCPKVRITSLAFPPEICLQARNLTSGWIKGFLFSAVSASASSEFSSLSLLPLPLHTGSSKQLLKMTSWNFFFKGKLALMSLCLKLRQSDSHFTETSGILAVWEPLNTLTQELPFAMEKKKAAFMARCIIFH